MIFDCQSNKIDNFEKKYSKITHYYENGKELPR